MGLSVESVAESLLVSPSKISRLETATRPASLRDVRDLCNLYGVSDEDRARLLDLASAAREHIWYQSADVQAVYMTYIGLEAAASQILTVQSTMLPGLLQTPEYARALIRGLRPPTQVSSEQIEAWIEVRARRQQILDSSAAPHFHALLDESVLRRPVAPASVMAAQLGHVLDLMGSGAVTVQVVAASIGSHPGLDGRFALLRFDDNVVRDTVYIEGLVGELFLDRESDVARYQEIFDHLAREVALDEGESRTLIEQVRTSWNT